jgi:hypothetical protein
MKRWKFIIYKTIYKKGNLNPGQALDQRSAAKLRGRNASWRSVSSEAERRRDEILCFDIEMKSAYYFCKKSPAAFAGDFN